MSFFVANLLILFTYIYMSHADVAPLLHLQECDIRLAEIIQSLSDFPQEIAKFEAEILTEKENLEQARAKHKEMELRHRELEGSIEDNEEHCRSLRNKQLNVKKNEEYRALEAEIESTQTKSSGLEDEAITLLLDLDDSKEVLDQKEKQIAEAISQLEHSIETVKGLLRAREAERDGAEADVEAAQKKVPAAMLKTYQFVKTQAKRSPWIVPVQSQICSGCHLKISGDVDSAMRRGGTVLVRCSNCGRILY
jgi:uncharacterized protein